MLDLFLGSLLILGDLSWIVGGLVVCFCFVMFCDWLFDWK